MSTLFTATNEHGLTLAEEVAALVEEHVADHLDARFWDVEKIAHDWATFGQSTVQTRLHAYFKNGS